MDLKHFLACVTYFYKCSSTENIDIKGDIGLKFEKHSSNLLLVFFTWLKKFMQKLLWLLWYIKSLFVNKNDPKIKFAVTKTNQKKLWKYLYFS